MPGKHSERTRYAPPCSTVGKRQNAWRNANAQVLMASEGPVVKSRTVPSWNSIEATLDQMQMTGRWQRRCRRPAHQHI